MTPDTNDQASSSSFAEQLCELTPVLRRKALQLTRDGSAADDLVQDTIERALRYESHFHHGSNLRAWSFRIMTNRFISQRRRAGAERRVLERSAVDPNGWAAREPAKLLPGLSPAVGRALSALPGRLRALLTLVDLQGGSYRDAAEFFDIPLGTVMSRLHRARVRLKVELSTASGLAFHPVMA